MDEFHLYETVEEVSKDLIMKAHLRYKPVCANVDFYSGFVYTMLGIPRELIYSDLCDCPYFRMECTPPGRTGKQRKDHPSGLQVCR